MNHIILIAAFLIASLALPLGAEQKPADSLKSVREELRANKKTLVTDNMDLTESEAKAFWPLYDEYQAEIEGVGDRMAELIKNYGITHKVMNNDIASKILRKFLDIQSDRVKLQEKYLPKFAGVLPMTKVFRYYQIENKHRVAVDYQITSEIPLVE